MSGIFQFKQFRVDQSGCAMKINTDGVLLGALVNADSPEAILDIGTGTGVIALMLAQRFTDAEIDAVEIDENTSSTTARNFNNSPFSDRLKIYPASFEGFLDTHPEKKYDLIISNPPFYIDSLKSPKAQKSLAKHTDLDFFEVLIKYITKHLSSKGLCWLILPLAIASLTKEFAGQSGLYLQKTIKIHSFENSEPHREIVCFGFNQISAEISKLTIYKAIGDYSEEYMKLLQPYFINF